MRQVISNFSHINMMASYSIVSSFHSLERSASGFCGQREGSYRQRKTMLWLILHHVQTLTSSLTIFPITLVLLLTYFIKAKSQMCIEFAPMERWGSGIYLFTGSFLVALVALAIAAMYVTVIYLLCRRVSVFTKKLRKNIEEMISRKSCLMTLDDVGLNEIGLLCRERFQVVSLVKGSCGMMTWLVTPAVTLGSAAAYRIIWDCLGPPMWAFCVVTGVMFLSIVVFCLLGGAVLTYQCTKVEETLRELRSRFPYADSIGLRQLQSDLDSFILLSKNDVFGFEVFGFLITFNVLLRALYIIGVIGLAAMQSRFGWNFNF
mmetsp:Transcript_19942/g.32720  ORF Transcript_19942/g.32720 Transcript_19942/m.32720 type:complete len:318 (-) Transcript_19942:736-1689(-)